MERVNLIWRDNRVVPIPDDNGAYLLNNGTLSTKYSIGIDYANGKSMGALCVFKNRDFFYITTSKWKMKIIYWLAKIFKQRILIEKNNTNG